MNISKTKIDDLNAVIKIEIEGKDYESKVESVLEFRSNYKIEDGIKEIISKLETNEYGLNENFELLNDYYGNYSIPKSNG